MKKHARICFMVCTFAVLFTAANGQSDGKGLKASAQFLTDLVSPYLPAEANLVHPVLKGTFGGSENILALFSSKQSAMAYSGLVLVPDGVGYRKVDLPAPSFTLSVEEPRAVFFANADSDKELELFIIGECYTGIGPTGAQPFYRTRVYDRKRDAFEHMEQLSEAIGTLKTAAAIRRRLPAIVSGGNEYQGQIVGSE